MNMNATLVILQKTGHLNESERDQLPYLEGSGGKLCINITKSEKENGILSFHGPPSSSGAPADTGNHSTATTAWTMAGAITDTAATSCAWTSSVILNHYAMQNGQRGAYNVDPSASKWWWMGHVLPQRVLPLLPNRSSSALFAAMLAYGAGASTMYHAHSDDRLQDAALAAGITLGWIVGTISGQNIEAIVLGILPWAVLLALSLSALGHRFARPHSAPGLGA